MEMVMAMDAVAGPATAAALSSSSARGIIRAPSMSRFAVPCSRERVGKLCGARQCCRKVVQQQQLLRSALPQRVIVEERKGFWTRQARTSVSENGPAYRSLQESRRPAAVPVSSGGGDEAEKGDNCGRLSRRCWLVSSASLGVFLSSPRSAPGLSWFPDLAADATSATAESSGRDETVTRTAESGALPAEDVKSWYKYRGEGFVLRIPPGYEDILDPGEEEEQQPSVYNEKAKEKPFAARFASPDRDEVLSIVVKPASQLRLSFFETKDISDFGSIKDAAGKFVPAGAKLVSARVINSKASRVPRTYYNYEFLVKGQHFTLSAGVSKGRVFVLGASAPQAKWKKYGSRLQLALSTFFLP